MLQRSLLIGVLAGIVGTGSLAQASVTAVTVPAASTSYSSGLVLDAATNKYLAIEGESGTGANTAYLVIDFGADGGGTYAWAYHFDGTKHGYDLITALNGVGGLSLSTQYYASFGDYMFVNAVYTAHGEVGNPDNYWHQDVGVVAGGTVQWDEGMGINYQTLTDGSFQGWYNNFAWPAENQIHPAIPVVPEPATLGLLALSALGLLKRKR